MDNRHTADSQFQSLRDWRQQGNGGSTSFPVGQQAQQPSTNNTYQYNGPEAGQAYYMGGPGQPQGPQPPFPGGPYQQGAQPPFPSGSYQQSPQPPFPSGSYQQGAQPPFPGGPSQQSPQPPFPSGTYQQHSPAPGQQQYPGGNYQQYGTTPTPGQNQYPGNQNYAPQPMQYPGGPDQQQSSPAQPQFPSGNYNAPGPFSPVQPQFPSGQQYGQPGTPGAPGAPFAPAQPAFYQANNAQYQQYPQGPQAPQKGGMGWKALFFIIPVVLIVFASIFGPNIVRNMSAGRHPLANIIPRKQAMAVPALSPQQLQGIQQSSDQMYYKQLARLYVSQMTLDEKIGQLMVVTYNTNEYSQDLDYMLNQQHVGGVIMYQLSFERQLQSAYQVKRDVAMMQQRATFPLFVSIDEEGWNVDRLGSVYPAPPNPKRLAADDMHQTNDPAVATSEGQRVAHDMMALGINVNFAPDVDVAAYHGYIDWDYRAFGTTPDDVLKYSAPYLEAMQAGGVIGTLKHFVGLGAVARGFDPHSVLPSVDLTPDQVNTHLIPFKHFIQSPNKLDHPGFIMPTDVMVPSIDPKYPTEFSHIFITDILRNQLGYDGVVITDGLQMGGVKLNGQTLSEADASVLALQAGCDMLLDIAGSDQVASVVTAVKAALQDGSLTQARIDEAVTRIITLKMERNVVPSVPGMNMPA